MSWAQRRSVRVLAVILAVILVLVVGVKVFLPAQKIRDLAVDEARTRLGRDVQVGEVAVTLRGGLGVRLADVVVANPADFAGAPLLQTAGVDLKLALGPLFKGEFQVHRLVIEAPHLTLLRMADGSDNFTFPGSQPEAATESAEQSGATAGPPALSIASLTVQNGRIDFQDLAAAAGGLQELHGEGLHLGLSLTNPDPDLFAAAGRLTAGALSLPDLVQVPPLGGWVDFQLTWGAATRELDLQDLAAEINGIPLTGTGQLVLAEAGPEGSLSFAAKDLTVSDLAGFLPPDLAAKLDGGADRGTLDLTTELIFAGEAEGGLHTSGTVEAHGIDLTLAQPFLPPAQPGQLAGRADGKASFTKTGPGPDGLSYQATVTTQGLSYLESGLVDDLQSLDATLQIAPDKFTLERGRAVFSSGTLDLAGTLRDPFPYFLAQDPQTDAQMPIPHLDFTLRTDRLDVDRLLPAASPGGAQSGSGTRTPVATPAATSVRFPGLTGSGTIAADSLIYMQVPLTAVQGQVAIADRRLEVRDVTGAVYRGTVTGEVGIDLNDLAKPIYTGRYDAKQIEVDNFMTRFAGLAGVVFGGCDLSGKFAAAGRDAASIRNSLTVNADAGVKQGRVVTSGNLHTTLSKLASQAGQTLNHEQALRDLATHISVEDGRVGVNDLTTRLGRMGDVTVGGYYGFDGSLSYTGTILLTVEQTDALFGNRVLADLAELLGSKRPQRLELPLSVGGTRADPKVKLDLGAVLGDLQQKAAQEQGRRLEDEAKNKLGDLLKKWK